ncbi:MAG: response regulator [Treponema sp.]|nr:response regulator [Treponema sp.]
MNNTRKNSILIVDDDDFNLVILTEILKSDYKIYSTTQGRKALEIANKISPDLILLDIVMPEIDGFDVLTLLKKNEKTKNIPVIIITVLEDIENEERSYDLEAADFIHKPFSVKIVKLKVRNQMQIVNQMAELIELHNKLEIAVVDAETTNKAKSDFLARMSHEIRTPLNAVLGISEIHLQDDNLQDDIKEAFLRIYSSGDLLLNIINNILDISKIEAGKLELIEMQYQVSGMIYDTVFMNMIKYEKNGVDFFVNVDEGVPTVLIGDEIRIKQILNNLLSNAFKYTAAGEVELSVNVEKSEEGVILVFRVRDTGQGMTSEQLNKLFEEYARFNMETNRATVGTGLGMGITQNLICMMKGEIKAESEQGRGSLFTVRLPQGMVSNDVLGKETVEKLRQFRSNYEPLERKVKIKREKMPCAKVLVVDDIDMNLYVTKGILAPYGLQVNTALNGAEAIEKIKKSKETGSLYDLVFMDHMMPVMDGFEAVKKIRELGLEYDKFPIIALTANAVTGMKDKFLSSGFNGFLSKPINILEMDSVLKEWIPSEKIIKNEEQSVSEHMSQRNDRLIKAFEELDDINTATGLKHVSGSIEVYCASMDIFYYKLESECNKLTNFIDGKDYRNFLISIHAMKSMLAVLGVLSLSEEAKIIETACYNEDIEFFTNKFVVFREKLLAFHRRLSKIFM